MYLVVIDGIKNRDGFNRRVPSHEPPAVTANWKHIKNLCQ